jgi:hypothetical protein
MKKIIALLVVTLTVSSCVTDQADRAKVKVNAAGMTGDVYVNQWLNRENRSHSPGGGVLLASAQKPAAKVSSAPLVYRQQSQSTSNSTRFGKGSDVTRSMQQTVTTDTRSVAERNTANTTGTGWSEHGLYRKIRVYEGQPVTVPPGAVPIAKGVVRVYEGESEGRVIRHEIRPGFEHYYDTTPGPSTVTTSTTTTTTSGSSSSGSTSGK